MRFQDVKRDYFAVREALFEITFLYASAVVEKQIGRASCRERVYVLV